MPIQAREIWRLKVIAHAAIHSAIADKATLEGAQPRRRFVGALHGLREHVLRGGL